jgi:hypothetical protein
MPQVRQTTLAREVQVAMRKHSLSSDDVDYVHLGSDSWCSFSDFVSYVGTAPVKQLAWGADAVRALTLETPTTVTVVGRHGWWLFYDFCAQDDCCSGWKLSRRDTRVAAPPPKRQPQRPLRPPQPSDSGAREPPPPPPQPPQQPPQQQDPPPRQPPDPHEQQQHPLRLCDLFRPHRTHRRGGGDPLHLDPPHQDHLELGLSEWPHLSRSTQ